MPNHLPGGYESPARFPLEDDRQFDKVLIFLGQQKCFLDLPCEPEVSGPSGRRRVPASRVDTVIAGLETAIIARLGHG